MIVLDTNVISVMMEEREEPAVLRWLDRQKLDDLYTTAVNVHELWFGIEKLARGRRRTFLSKGLDDTLSILANRILPLDVASAAVSGRLQAEREAIGRPMELGDCLIAGIAAHFGARIATRNVRHFTGLSITLINPWSAPT